MRNFGKLVNSQITGLKQHSFHFPRKVGDQNQYTNYGILALVSYARKVLFRIFMANLELGGNKVYLMTLWQNAQQSSRVIVRLNKFFVVFVFL